MGRACAVCGSVETARVGPIYHFRPEFVAGVRIELEGMEFAMLRCPRCGFQFKDPVIPEEKLRRCYEAASESNWELDPDPVKRRFGLFRETLERFTKGRRMLDIGCFNGAMLKSFGPEWELCGVEPGRAAAKVAQERGVKVLAGTIEELPAGAEGFDAITAMDVLEHLADPVGFMQRVRGALKPGGVAMILTGDTDAWVWGMLGSRYWYASLPEHLSFFNRSAVEELARRTGFEVASYVRISHEAAALSVRAADVGKCVAYRAGNAVGWLGVGSMRKRFLRRGSPICPRLCDHMLAVVRKLATE